MHSNALPCIAMHCINKSYKDDIRWSLSQILHRLSKMMALRLFFALFLAGLTSAYIANPCGFNSDDSFRPAGCPGGKKNSCAATIPYYGKRYRFCASPPPPNPACICPALFKPVCCTVKKNKYISQTFTASNSCSCSCFKGSRVLFEGKCTSVPRKNVICTLEFNPTCCYLKKFDLTFTTSNPCGCTSSAGGVIVSKRLCKIK